MSFCRVCSSELQPGVTACAICGTPVESRPAQQPAAPNPPKKKKKLALKIIIVVLTFLILAVGGLFVADYIMYQKEIESDEYITDFPVLKTETDFVVFDEEDFPSENYRIKVEKVLYGGVLKSDAFKQTKIIIDDESTDPVYHIDFEEDGKYIITLEDITEKENVTSPLFSHDTDDDENSATDDDATIPDKDDDDKPSKVVIEVIVDDSNKDAIGSVNINSKPGDKPVELPVNEYERISGTYEGSYFASQGETGLTLTVYMEDEQCKAVFDFYNLPSRTNAKSGKYYMDVFYDEDTDEYTFEATEWIEQPSSYFFLDLKGKLDGNVFSGESPTKFSVTKTSKDQSIKPNTDAQQPSVDVTVDTYERDSEIYAAYLTGGELAGIAEYMNEDYIVVESCMADFNGDGTYELVISVRDEEYPGPRGYYTISAVYTITDGIVTRMGMVENPGGTGGGDNYYVKYDNQTNKHTIVKTSLGRDGAWAFDYERTAYNVSDNQLSEYFQITTSFRSFDNVAYESTAEQIKADVPVSYEENGGIYYHKINNNYVSEAEHDEADARFTEPTDSAYQMKTGTFSNPLGL